MKRLSFRLLSIFLIATALAAIPGFTLASDIGLGVEHYGGYTALGDSIVAGYGDETGDGYVGRIYDYLADNVSTNGLKLYNFGKIGNTSGELLKSVKKNLTIRKALKESRFITIAIGGNNLLIPVIEAVKGAFNIKPVDSSQLANEIEKAFKNDPYVLFKLIKLMQPEGIPEELKNAVNQFAVDWIEIAKEVRKIAPDAYIYVSTVINPMKADSPFYEVFSEAVNGINEIIMDGAVGEQKSNRKSNQKGSYKVIDVNSAFSNYTGDLPLTNFDFFGGSLDPHPTLEGYELIYRIHVKELKKDISAGFKIAARKK